MAVTYQTPVQIDYLVFRIPFSSDAATPVSFRVFREGVQIAAFVSADGSGDIDVAVGLGEHPFIEVLDDDTCAPSIAFPGKFTINWLAVTGAVSYTVQESVSAVWTDRGTVLDTGRGAYQFDTRWLEDVTTHQFRVLATDSAGNSGTALSFSSQMVRHPDAPDVTYTYNGSATPTVTIAAA